jgi:probable phosphomutase (TIGR03848 family)
MATLILARHGRTTANATGVLAGRSPGHRLDDRGVEQARETADRLAGLRLAALVSSPLERCRQTADLIADRQRHRLTVTEEPRLSECDYGDWTGRELKTLAKEKLWRTVQQQPSAVVFPAGESLAQMAGRAVVAVREWDARVEQEHGPDAVWVAVTHGDVVKAVLGDALGQHLDHFQRIVVDPASLSIVRYTSERPFVLATNTVAGDLAALQPPRRRRAGRRGRAAGDAAVGGGAGALRPDAAEAVAEATP